MNSNTVFRAPALNYTLLISYYKFLHHLDRVVKLSAKPTGGPDLRSSVSLRIMYSHTLLIYRLSFVFRVSKMCCLKLVRTLCGCVLLRMCTFYIFKLHKITFLSYDLDPKLNEI